MAHWPRGRVKFQRNWLLATLKPIQNGIGLANHSALETKCHPFSASCLRYFFCWLFYEYLRAGVPAATLNLFNNGLIDQSKDPQ